MTEFGNIEMWVNGELKRFKEQSVMKILSSKGLTRDQYKNILTSYYYFAKTASPMYALAAYRTKDKYERLKSWYLKRAQREYKQEQFIINDLKALGEMDTTLQQTSKISPELSALCAYNFGFIEIYGAVGVLGTPLIMSNLSEALAFETVDKLKSSLGKEYVDQGTSYFFAHGHLDKNTLEEVKELILTCNEKANLDLILLNAKSMLNLYANFLNACLDLNSAD